MRPLLIVLLVILALAFLPVWPYSSGWGVGYFPSGILGLLLIVLLVMAFTGSRAGPRI
jgi:lipopolysaccharide export LptBFGC system permease protein LptF